MRIHHALAALALLSAAAQAQVLQITSATRDYAAIATGYDYEFDDGVGSNASTQATAGPWIQDHAFALSDYYHNEVSSAAIVHESEIGPGGVSLDFFAVSSAEGSLHYTDGWSDCGLDVTFTAPVQTRYRLRVDATTTDDGYAIAEARLHGPAGSVANVYVYDGAGDQLEQRGWLPAGVYDLDASVEAVAIAGSGVSLAAVTTLQLDLQIVHAADFDTNGNVNFLDVRAFRLRHQAGSPAADFDGDGDTDAADWTAFHRAWRAR